MERKDDLFLAIAQKIPGMLYQFELQLDGSFHLPYLSDGVRSIFGFSPDEGLGNAAIILNCIHEDDQKPLLDAIAVSAREVSDFSTSFRIRPPGGGVKWVKADSIPIRREDGSILWNGILVDISEQKQAERTLRDNEERFRNIVNTLPQVVAYLDTQLIYRYANKACEKLFGLPAERIIGRSAPEIIGRKAYEKIRPHLAKVLQGETVHYREDLLYPDHQIHSIDGWLIPQFSGDGAILGYYAILHDLTEHVETIDALRESELRFRSLFENNPTIILIIDPETDRIVDANPAAAAFYGWSRDELLHRSLAELAASSAEQGQEAATLPDAGGSQLLVRQVTRAGAIREVEIFNSPVMIGKKNYCHTIIHDVTERRRAVESQKNLELQLLQAQKIESIGRLAGGVAHDLNNLLAPIIGYGEIVLQDLGEGDVHREALEQILKAGFRARDLVAQLLAFGRKQTLEFIPINLNELIVGFNRLLRRAIREDVIISLQLAETLPSIKADRGQLEQVVMNLAVNAQDAMPQGGDLAIATGMVMAGVPGTTGAGDRQQQSYVFLSVSDTGVGMTDEVRQQIYEPFFTTKQTGKGTGLGLSTVHGIVSQHGGSIRAASRPGGGSVFTLMFPASSEQSVVEAETESSLCAPAGSETILLVEDNFQLRELTRIILERKGYSVLEAEDGRQALTLLAGNDAVDLLLTDVVMPEMNGRQLYEEVAARRPTIKVLFMSGYADETITQHGIIQQGLTFIQKPFTSQDLLEKISNLLHRQQARSDSDSAALSCLKTPSRNSRKIRHQNDRPR